MNALTRTPILLLGWLAVVGVSHAAEEQLPAFSGPIKGFTVPARTYLLKGETAVPLSGDRLQLEGITVETRGTNRLNFLLSTPRGEYRRKEDLVSSTNELTVRSLDGNFLLSGTGYDFKPKTNQLQIHSNVLTRFESDFFARRKGATNALVKGRTNAAPLEVTSTTFSFDGDSGDAFYREAVRITDGETLEALAGQVKLNVRELTNDTSTVTASEDVRLQLTHDGEPAHARASEAVFTTAPGIDWRVELRGEPAWSYQLLSGGADLVRWTMVTNRYEFVGEGDARIRFPASMFETNNKAAKVAKTNEQWIDLTSTRYRVAPGRLEFDGDVRATQSTNWFMGAKRLAVNLDATNRPTRMEADGEFVFDVEREGRRGHGNAGNALVDYLNDGRPVVTLTGDPRWKTDDFEKSADRIQVVDPTGEAFYSGEGNVKFLMKGLRLEDLNWFGVETNATPQKTVQAATNISDVLITADHSSYRSGVASFAGHVKASSGTNYLTAAKLTMRFTPERQLTNLVASGGVTVRQQGVVMSADEARAEFDEEGKRAPRVFARGKVQFCGRMVDGKGRLTSDTLRYDGMTGNAVFEGTPELILFPQPLEGSKARPLPPMRQTGAREIVWNLRDQNAVLHGLFKVVPVSPNDIVSQACD